MADDLIQIERGDSGETVIVRPMADVDMSRSPQLRSALRDSQSKKLQRLIVDLSEVGYMDSSGLATLVEAMRSAKRTGTRMVLCAMNEKVRAIFEIARLDQFFVIVDELEAARSA